MSITIQTNYASMVAEQNLATNNTFQTKTIEALTSGYRINSSGDDPAGLAVANQFRSNVAELTQGVINANFGVSTLQIIDGGLSNISMMLDRMKTLATESASSTFTGNRATVDAEYQTLQGEIDREAGNIGLGGANTSNAVDLKVYIGGSGSVQNNALLSVDLAGAKGLVDSAALGVGGTSVNGAVQGTANAAINLNTNALQLVNDKQTFAFTGVGSAGTGTITATVAGGLTGITTSQALSSLNSQLSPYGISANLDANGHLQFQSQYNNAFSVVVADAATPAKDIMAAATYNSAALANTTGTANALAAITAINAAVQQLGTVQGTVGA